ncbi:MAG: hypothetical protein DCC58_19425 [Chloroflexi bacterium]|nr:MAG: hypothetical protein DCC58_19425 [Chloroflexota bacterium]
MNSIASKTTLAGLRVLVTRARDQAEELSQLLRAAGATPLELPAIAITPAPSAPLDAALATLEQYDWVVLTSVNGVQALERRMEAHGIPPEAFAGLQVAAIGRATAAALEKLGIRVAFVPDEFVAEAVVAGLVERGVAGKRVLLPRAEVARDALPQGLEAAGATVDVVVAYRTSLPDDVPAEVLSELLAGNVDIATFGSPSAVRNVLALAGGTLPEPVVIACIGPITAQAARQTGLRVDVVAEEYSMPGLVAALERFVAGQGERSTAG